MRNARVSMRTVQNNCFELEFSVKNILESSHLGSNYINYTACNSHSAEEKMHTAFRTTCFNVPKP